MLTQRGVVECGESIAHMQDLAGVHAEFFQAQREQQRSEIDVAADFAAEAHRLAGAATGATAAAGDAVTAAKLSVSATKENRDAIKDVAVRTEEVHSALNGALAAAKKLAADQYEKALAQAIELLKSKAEQTILDQTAAMRTEIQMLNAKLASLTPTIVVQGLGPTVTTPDPDKPPAPLIIA